jgi:hypothetical protein
VDCGGWEEKGQEEADFDGFNYLKLRRIYPYVGTQTQTLLVLVSTSQLIEVGQSK